MIISPPGIFFVDIFGLKLHFYSICIFVAAILSFFTLIFLVKKGFVKVKKEVIYDMAPGLIIWAVIGARLYYVLLNLDYFLLKPLNALFVWQGGIAIHGAILGGIFYLICYAKKHKISFFKYSDSIALVLPLGQAIGRWGNFFNSEAFGMPTSANFPLKLFVDKTYRPEIYLNNEYFHPAFLYESILDFLIFLILIFLYKNTAEKFDGIIFFSYIILYSLVRIPLEFLRLDTVSFVFNIPFPVVVSVIGILVGTIGIIYRLRQS